MMAMVQVRRPSAGQAYYRRKLAEGKSPKEALWCLKRRLSDAIYRCLQADQHLQPNLVGPKLGQVFKPVADPGPEWRWLRSAVAGGRASRCREGVGWAPQRAVAGVDPEPFPDPVLDPAQHLLDLVAQPGQSQRGPGRPVAARPPAVGHDRDGHLEEGRGPGRDVSRWEVDRAREVALGPGGWPPGVHQHEPGRAAGQGGVDVGDIGVEGQPRGEVGGGVRWRSRFYAQYRAGSGRRGVRSWPETSPVHSVMELEFRGLSGRWPWFQLR
jgi:hypothetical protein